MEVTKKIVMICGAVLVVIGAAAWIDGSGIPAVSYGVALICYGGYCIIASLNSAWEKRHVIKTIAAQIAELQRKADEAYYRDNPPLKHSNEYASWLIDQVIPLKHLSENLGICDEVYREAYKIYDFRNSGRNGYTLRSGKIVKQDGE